MEPREAVVATDTVMAIGMVITNDFTEDKATLFGAGMVTVGVFGKTALITKGVGVVAATKAGVLAGGFICPPAAICIGLACVGAGLINHFGKRNWW